VVLERYDLELARTLVQGCDAWLNTPLRPLEASGTSGMKAVANGGLHISVRDGWWAEAYRPDAGWAESLYTILENEVAPAFYERDGDGVPRKWVARMKASIASFSPVFSTHRMVSDYATRTYRPARYYWRQLTGDGLAAAREAAGFLAAARAAWPSLAVVSVLDDAHDEISGGTTVQVRAQVNTGGLLPGNLRVELLYGDVDAEGSIIDAQIKDMELDGASGQTCRYRGEFTPPRGGRAGYTVRVTPQHPALPAVVDTGLVAWAR
jgi:starch phosphorylase